MRAQAQQRADDAAEWSRRAPRADLPLPHPSSAAAWCSIAEQEVYTISRILMPMDRVAERVAGLAGPVGLDVIGLGCGDGKDEVRLTQCLPEHPKTVTSVCTYSISVSRCAVRSTVTPPRLADPHPVSVYAIQGNFRNLQRYTTLLHSPERSHRRRIVCVCSATPSPTCKNEIMFVRNSLLGFAPGLLLLNVPATMARADDPEIFSRKDRRLAGRPAAETMSAALSKQDRMFCELLRRYIPGLKSTEIKSVLDFAACPVPGSYAADIRANVKMTSGEVKHFSIAYLKRYDQERLDEPCAKRLASGGVLALRRGIPPRLLLLYQRMR